MRASPRPLSASSGGMALACGGGSSRFPLSVVFRRQCVGVIVMSTSHSTSRSGLCWMTLVISSLSTVSRATQDPVATSGCCVHTDCRKSWASSTVCGGVWIAA